MAVKNDEKLTKWEQLKMKSKVVRAVDLDFEGDIFKVDIQSVSQASLDAINEKYDDMKKPRPQEFIKELKKYIDYPEDSQQYLDWQKRNKAIESLRMAELALAFLVEKPTGETTDEQIRELKDVLRPGDFIKVVQEGYKACGFDFDDEKVNAAKNS